MHFGSLDDSAPRSGEPSEPGCYIQFSIVPPAGRTLADLMEGFQIFFHFFYIGMICKMMQFIMVNMVLNAAGILRIVNRGSPQH
jgi:hypothetical protein